MDQQNKTRDAVVAPPEDRQRWIVALVDGMLRSDSVSVAFDDHPLPLLDWLATARFGEFSASFRPGPPGRWVVSFTKR
ncbi:MAG: DUF2249 domain-containing protein [Longimicrobiales bacterium]